MTAPASPPISFHRPDTVSTTRANVSRRFTAVAHRSSSCPRRSTARLRKFGFHIVSSNRKWTVLVADDEPAARRGVRQLLAAFKDFTIAGECRDGREVLSVLDTLNPDVIFLDVQMPEIDGFEVIRRRTPARMPAIVFLTAYDQFAIRAFEAEALDYPLKPVSEA